MKKFVTIWIIATLIINTVGFLGATSKNADNGSNPVYLTRAQKENPSSLFIEFIPYSAMAGAVIAGVGMFFGNKGEDK
jgi:hypothetical protein